MTTASVYVLVIDVDREPDRARFFAYLDAAEQQRALAFRLERDRERFIVRRGKLRELLSGYLDQSPACIRIQQNGFGKPSVSDANLHFSVAHSRSFALYALSRDVELGCDIEAKDATLPIWEIAHHFFSPEERRTLRHLPSDQRSDAFFNFWTRKEAYVKALGCGLSLALDSFDVPLALGGQRLLPLADGKWSVRSFEPAEGYQAAVVASGRDWQLRAADIGSHNPESSLAL